MSLFLLTPALGSDRGLKREDNEDAVFYDYPAEAARLNSYGAIFVLADGVGSLSGGQKASEAAVRWVVEQYYQQGPDSLENQLIASIQGANAYIQQHLRGTATTLVAGVMQGENLVVAHVGDSPAYLITGGGIKRLTRDHVILPDPSNPSRTKLSRAVGHLPLVQVDTLRQTLKPGDKVLLLSDGATRYLNEDRLLAICTHLGPTEAVRQIIQESNRAGGADNISAILVAVGARAENPARQQDHQQNLNPSAVWVDLVSPEASTAYSISSQMAPASSSTPSRVQSSQVPGPAPSLRVGSQMAPPPRPKPSPANLMPTLGILALVVLMIGLGLIWAASSGDSNPSTSPTLTATSSDTPSPSDTPTSSDTPSPSNTPRPSPQPPSPSPVGLRQGAQVRFSSSALTYRNIGESISAFVIVTGQVYLISEVFMDQAGLTWYALQAQEEDSVGWINEEQLPPHEILP